jgi:glycosyltransferase involved in cell wall biosynthesis
MHITCVPKIALLMMVKNEEKRLLVSLESVKDVVDSLIIFDTGSTDSTLDIVETFANKNNIALFLKRGEFTDFSTSRNVSLEFADEVASKHYIDYLLLLDCNDELQNPESLRDFATKHLDDDLNNPYNTAWLMKQTWYSGSFSTYFNVRFIRPRQGWFFQGVVHEFIAKKDGGECYITAQMPGCVLYQDRTLDDDKSGRRFHRDKDLLLQEYRKNPLNSRTVFYLAQTYSCLNMLQESYYYYNIRSSMQGFIEETFHSFLRMGMIIGDLKLIPKDKLPPINTTETTTNPDTPKLCWETACSLFMNAFEVCPRVEPLIYIIEHYRFKEEWLLAYTFAKLAISLPPTKCILFVESFMYDYTRWHLMGIVAFYAIGKLGAADDTVIRADGRRACLQAIKVCDRDIDKSNLKFYES